MARRCLRHVLKAFGKVVDVSRTILGHQLFLVSLKLVCMICVALYFNLCGMMLVRDLLGYERQNYVCVSFRGQLGNFMFKYAFLYAMAKKKDLKMVLPVKPELMDVFEIDPGKLEAYGVNKKICWCFSIRQGYWDCAHNEQIEHIQSKKDISFIGSFQSWFYWKGYENEIRKQFQFKSYLKAEALIQLRNILTSRGLTYSDGTVIVGIHIRRGDYLQQRSRDYGYRVADEKYLKNAMQYFRDKYKKILFIACSNGILWTRQTLSKYNDVQIVSGNSPQQDMALLTSTNHTIMTVGTFGWWIGFLTNGTTVYYKYPYVEGSAFSKHFKRLEEHFYPGWIPME